MADEKRHFGLAVLFFFTLFGGEAIRNTISWYGFAVWAVLLLGLSIAVLIGWRRDRRGTERALRLSFGAQLARPRTYLVVLLVWMVASLAWSDYPGGTLVGIAATGAATTAAVAMTVRLTWPAIVRALLAALTGILALSLLFEATVSLLIRRPVLPVFPIDVVPGEKIPQAFYWSRDLLFQGGPIQGILGNANLLGFVALLAAVIAADLLRRRAIAVRYGASALVLGLLTLALTRSATVIAATAAVLLVAGAAAILTRWPVRRAGRTARSGIVARALLIGAVLAALTAGVALRGPLLDLVGKSPDLTGRGDIWATVLALFGERPVAGWGWTGYWQPWIPLFQDLAPRNGVVYLQAHNAFLDVAFQLGSIGLVFFVALVVSTLVRAVRSRTLLPVLLVAALLAQSLAESRLLYEGNWALLVILAVTLDSRGAAERSERAVSIPASTP